MSYPPGTIIRNTTAARINHWITAACFVLLTLSGLSMFHPLLFFLALLFGSGQWARAIHPWIGMRAACELRRADRAILARQFLEPGRRRLDGRDRARIAQRGGRRSGGRPVQRRAEIRLLVDGAARARALPHRPRDLGSIISARRPPSRLRGPRRSFTATRRLRRSSSGSPMSTRRSGCAARCAG